VDDEDKRNASRLNLGESFYQRGENERAIEMAREVLQYDPHNIHAHALQAAAAMQTGNAGLAKASLDTLLSRAPNWPPAHLLAGQFHAYIRPDHFRAEEHFRTALQLDPDNPNAHASRGTFAAHCGRLEEGITHAHRGLKLDPENPFVLHTLQSLYRVNEEPELAAEYGERALAADPENAHHHLEVGLNQLGGHTRGAASGSFREALRLAPVDAGNKDAIAIETVRQHPFFKNGFFLSFEPVIVVLAVLTPVFWYLLSLLFHPLVYLAWLALGVVIVLYAYHGLFRLCVWRMRRRIGSGRL